MMESCDITVVILNNHCYAQGGASRVAIDEAVGLAQAGHHVLFIGAIGPVCEELKRTAVEVICLQQRELANAAREPSVAFQGIWNVLAQREVGTILKRLDSRKTVVHLHGFTQALSSSVVHAAISRGFKVVYTMHDYFSACPNGGFFDYVSGVPCQRRALSLGCVLRNCDKRHYAHKLYRVGRAIVQRNVGGMPTDLKHYIALSRRSERVLRAYLPRDARIWPLENPVAIAKASPVSVRDNGSLVAVGRLDPEKGIGTLIEAAKRTRSRVTLIGDGPLKRQAEDSGLCRVTGWQPRERVLMEMESARCLAFPSLWYETYGMAVAEAAARGVPAIVSDISAAAERVEHGVTGWHFRAGSVEDLVRVLELVNNDAVVQAAGSEAYRRFWERPPTLERHTRCLTALYRAVLGTSLRDDAERLRQ